MVVVLLLAVLAVLAGLLGVYWTLHGTVLLRLPKCTSPQTLHGKTAIVTGANTGIGKATALDLARRGARVILACRDQQRAESAVRDIVMETGSTDVVYMHLDLASLKSVRSFAEKFLKTESRLDLLINNAGLLNDGLTSDGFGLIFGVNHLGHFLLTALLRDRLEASGRSRVVTVASKAYELGRVDFRCLVEHRDVSMGTGNWQLFQKYCHSKLCNVLFTYELARRLQGSGVTCYSVHPGAIKTEIGRHAGVWWRLMLAPIVAFFFMDAASGAQTTLHCALEQGIEPLSGHYFALCQPLLNIQAKARDDAVASKLWELSESFCGLA